MVFTSNFHKPCFQYGFKISLSLSLLKGGKYLKWVQKFMEGVVANFSFHLLNLQPFCFASLERLLEADPKEGYPPNEGNKSVLTCGINALGSKHRLGSAMVPRVSLLLQQLTPEGKSIQESSSNQDHASN